MKILIKLLFILLLTSCAVQNSKFFSEIQNSSDDNYGYVPENPICIKNGALENSVASSYYFISRLRDKAGKPLKLIGRASVLNPNYKGSPIGLYNRYTGTPVGGQGTLLDKYILLTESNQIDTIKIYINSYNKGILKTPKGLKFEKE